MRFEVAEDEQFRRIVRRGASQALAEESHSVHAEITGLQPGKTYWYRFKWGPTVSPVGRTRTAPPLDSTAPMRFAFASCQNFTNGFYSAYADMAKQDLDLVVHLGDYIYEGPGSASTACATTFRRPSCSPSATTARGMPGTRPTRICVRPTRRSRG